MESRAGRLRTILELEARHDELLGRLDDLDERIRRVLAQCSATGRQKIATVGQEKHIA